MSLGANIAQWHQCPSSWSTAMIEILNFALCDLVVHFSTRMEVGVCDPPLREVWYVDTKLLDSGYHLEVDFLLAISRGGKTKYIYELTITLSVPQVQLGDVIISLFSFTTACVSALEVRQSFGGVWR